MFRLLLTIALLSPAVATALDDPMRPPGGRTTVTSQGGGGYHLTATRIGAERRTAVINGRRLSVGDRIGRAEVVAIHPATATIELEGRRQTLRLLPLTVKRPSKAERP